MSKKYKVYGNESTHLRLTEKAQRYCDVTDPLEIREFCHERDVEDENGNIIDVEKTYTYDLIGGSEDYDMTEEELTELLEYLTDYFDEVQKQNVTWEDIKANASNTAENSDRFDLSKSLAQNYMDSIDIDGGSVTVIQDPANGDAYVTYFVNNFEEADCFISIEKLRKLLPELPQYIA